MCVWNTSHLLKRSIHTYANQDFPKDQYELIIIDDNSMDNVMEVIEPYAEEVDIKYCRLEHNHGMRGNTVAFNTAFNLSKAEVIAETTPETMFQPNVVRKMYEEHLKYERAFIAFKTFNLTPKLQLQIDGVPWKDNLSEIALLDGFNDPWVQANVNNNNFRTHQTCSIKKSVWKEVNNGYGFPLFMDYGSEDPWYSSERERLGIQNITIMDVMPIHQWHPPFQYWMSKGYAPKLNRHAHTMSNYMNDRSGHVPDGGTCEIWDGGSHEPLPDSAKNEWAAWDSIVRGTGCKLV